MLFALPGYQFPYTVMNRCFYLIVIKISKGGSLKGLANAIRGERVGLIIQAFHQNGVSIVLNSPLLVY